MPCSQVLEREQGGELTLRLKTWGEVGRQEGVIEETGEEGREEEREVAGGIENPA